MPSTTTDPITLEVIGNTLQSIVDEMGEALIRSAYSSNIKERRDISTILFGADGQTLAQAEHIPLQLGALIGIVEGILSRYPVEALRPGDTFICNDPYTGGASHLPDIALASPVFVDERLIGFVANVGHHADFVQRAHANIYQEGIRIPPVCIYRDDKLVEDMMHLILTNCQVPEERTGDFRAQFAANRLGVRRMTEVCRKFGTDVVLGAAAELLDYTESKTRDGIRAIPDGTFTFQDVFDNLELPNPINLAVTVTVSDDTMVLNFDAPEQQRAPINMVDSALRACAYYGVKSLLDPTILPNGGLYRPLDVKAPLGSILNATPPAAVMSRSQTAQRVVDLIYGALAPAIPMQVTAAHNGANTALYLSGRDPRTQRFYSHVETYGGGFGARASKDGLDGVQVYITNTSNLPIESFEHDYPLLVERYELVQDSGGPGKFRGGLGLRREMRLLDHEGRYRIHGTRQEVPPWGVFGGDAGALGYFEKRLSDGTVERVHHAEGVLAAGESIAVITPGAGGYGPVSERDPELVKSDLREEKISPEAARDVYGLSEDEIASVRALSDGTQG